jgi:hypothetical protein
MANILYPSTASTGQPTNLALLHNDLQQWGVLHLARFNRGSLSAMTSTGSYSQLLTADYLTLDFSRISTNWLVPLRQTQQETLFPTMPLLLHDVTISATHRKHHSQQFFYSLHCVECDVLRHCLLCNNTVMDVSSD